MNKDAIIIIDDDEDDLELLELAFQELKIENQVVIFNNGFKFLEYMKATHNNTFLILCDMNMPVINGLELKRIISEDEDLRLKCVPFVFMSTSTATDAVMKAYSFGVQGYFIKPTKFSELKELAVFMINYWSKSQRPTR